MNIFQLVSNESAEKEDYTNTTDIECGICYSYKLENGEAPETICKLCHRGYHSICLYHVRRGEIIVLLLKQNIVATVQPNNNTEFQHIIR